MRSLRLVNSYRDCGLGIPKSWWAKRDIGINRSQWRLNYKKGLDARTDKFLFPIVDIHIYIEINIYAFSQSAPSIGFSVTIY